MRGDFPITVYSREPLMDKGRVTHEPPDSISGGTAACGAVAPLSRIAAPGGSSCARSACRDLRLRRRAAQRRLATLAPLG